MINDTQDCICGIEFLHEKKNAIRKAVAYLTASYMDESDVRITYIFDPDTESEYPTYDRYIFAGNRMHTFTTNDRFNRMSKILETMQVQLEAKACDDCSQFEVTYPVFFCDEAEAIREEK
jgi:hypothetical protein